MPAIPAYRRLTNDARREELLRRGEELFAKHGYDELSMSRFAREAGISKALLYHYFPSKRALFEAVLAQAAQELQATTEPDPALPAVEQLAASLGAFLAWIDDHAEAYVKLMASLQVAEVRELIDDVRKRTAQRILAGIAEGPPPPAVRAAVRGWLWYMDGVCLDWVAERDMTREEVQALLMGTLAGALMSAGASLPAG